MESHSPAPRIMHGCGRRDRIVVDIISFQEGSIIELTSTGTVRVTGSDEEEDGTIVKEEKPKTTNYPYQVHRKIHNTVAHEKPLCLTQVMGMVHPRER
uniref:Uncharacterized protein n=1 Tax=Hordeum vulgare subsp. vulgare TaxID=112509 RepID=C1IJB3_HORVV|nr:unknown protein [Hordeum vulgare subsp. vulgare]